MSEITKGLTPVVATLLFVGLTVASAGALYTYYDAVGDDSGTHSFNKDNLKVESCWNDGTNAYVTLRNTGDKTVNLSKISLVIEDQTPEMVPSPEMLSSGQSGSLEMNESYLKERTDVEMHGYGPKKEFTCRLEQDSPPSPGGGIPAPGP